MKSLHLAFGLCFTKPVTVLHFIIASERQHFEQKTAKHEAVLLQELMHHEYLNF